MQKTQLKLQKAVIFGSLVLSGVVVFYALGFSTELYTLSYHMDSSSSLFYVPGAELYAEAQPFNRAFLTMAVWYMIACIAMFLTLTHRRRLYYISNYITSLVYAGYSCYLGQTLITHALDYRARYLQLDFEKLRKVTEMMKMRYVESTLVLDAGVVLGCVMFAFAILLCLNLILKTLWMRREKWAEEVSL